MSGEYPTDDQALAPASLEELRSDPELASQTLRRSLTAVSSAAAAFRESGERGIRGPEEWSQAINTGALPPVLYEHVDGGRSGPARVQDLVHILDIQAAPLPYDEMGDDPQIYGTLGARFGDIGEFALPRIDNEETFAMIPRAGAERVHRIATEDPEAIAALAFDMGQTVGQWQQAQGTGA